MGRERQGASEANLRQLLALQDRERRLLACDIHDGFIQELVAAQLGIDQLLERLLDTDADSVETLLKIRARVRKAVDEARVLIGELRPDNLDHQSLAQALQDVVNQVNAQHHLAVHLVFHVKDFDIDAVLKSTLIRIVQESLHNVARHAKTKDAVVEVAQVDHTLRLMVSDEGVGFDPHRVPPDRFGLIGIRERARLFHGKATIRTQLGKGTKVIVELPIGAWPAAS